MALHTERVTESSFHLPRRKEQTVIKSTLILLSATLDNLYSQKKLPEDIQVLTILEIPNNIKLIELLITE